MSYKERQENSEETFPIYHAQANDDFFEEGDHQVSYDRDEWRDKIGFLLDQISQQNYEIYPFFIYISACESEIPYDFLIDSELLKQLLDHFNELVSNLFGDKDIQRIILTPEEEIKIVDSYLLIIIRIVILLLKTDFLIENTFFEDDFFNALSQLCFYRIAYCRVKEECNETYSLCVESLKLTKILFDSSPSILHIFEEQFNFSYFLNIQYIIARVFEIKYYSLNALLPWNHEYPGNRRIYDLFHQEMTKTIKNENAKIFEVPDVKQYLNTIDNDLKKKTKNDYFFNSSDKKAELTSLFVSGFYQFIQFRYVPQNEDEEPSEEMAFISMNYALDNDIIELATFSILTNHTLTVLNGFKIINLYLKEGRLPDQLITLFLSEIRGKMPELLNHSIEVCKEEIKMLKYLTSSLSEKEFIGFFDSSFMDYFMHVMNGKSYEWIRYLLDFIGFLLTQMNASFLENFLNDIDVVELFTEINKLADDKITNSIFDGIFTIIGNSKSLRQMLIDNGIEDEIDDYIENPLFSEKAQAILNFIKSEDADE